MDRLWRYLILISGLIILDQMTKGYIQEHFSYGESVEVIPHFFHLTYIKNQGAAFGLGADAAPWVRDILFRYIPLLACFFIAWLVWAHRNQSFLLGSAYSLILAGAVGNLWDRFTLGYVVDFLDFFYEKHHFPAFNVADSCITIAAGLLILDFFLGSQALKKEKEEKG